MALAVVIAFFLVVTPSDAAAYIDPSAGSILLQVLLGGAAGVAVLGKLYYRRLMKLLGRRLPDEKATAAEPSQDER